MKRPMKRRRGQAAPAALVLIAVLFAVAAVTVDALHLAEVRRRTYQVAADAALQGARAGAEYDNYVAEGAVTLDELTARAQALSVVNAELAASGIVTYTAQVEVLPNATGGTINNFPPVGHAQQVGGSTWTETEPSVGVYVEVPIETMFCGWLMNANTIPVHVFVAAGIVQTN